MNDAVMLLRLDQRQRWKAGEPVLVERYLEQQPALRADPDGLLDLIYNEIVLREETGEAPVLEEYLERFPQLADPLRLQFSVHRVLEDAPLSRPTTPLTGAARTLEAGLLPTFPGYELLDELGRGGMGVVYLARQLSLKRLVALKVIRSGSHASARELARFRTEAEAVARLQHPNIVHIHEVGEAGGLPYLCLEYIDGPSLDRAVGGKPLAPRWAAQLVETLARAMHYAHECGIIHRDLKPANVLLRSAERGMRRGGQGEGTSAEGAGFELQSAMPKITDFGLAKLVHDDPANPPTLALLGTPNYMAPEQAGGKGTPVGPPADVYALGAVLYELLTGQPPFQGDSALEVLELVRREEPVPPARVCPGLPRDLETICLKCLAKEPGRRYVSALDLAEDLRRFQADEPIQARRAGLGERAVKWARRRPAVAGLIAVSLAAVATLLLLNHRHWAEVQANREQARAEERQEHASRLQQARAHYQRFAQYRGDALFYGIYGTLFPDNDALTNLTSTRTAIQQALESVGMSSPATPLPTRDPTWSEREQAEVTAGCYQLLLLQADATAIPVPRQTPADHRRRLGQALALLDRAARLLPPTASYHLRRGRYLAQLGDEAGARREQEQAAASTPTSMLDYFLLGDERFRQGDVASAAQCFHKALVLEPNDFWSRYFLAVCRLKLKRAAEAEADFSQCLARRPDFRWTRVLRGLAYGDSNAFEAAEADFQAALQNGASADIRYTVHVSRGLLRFRRRQLDEALADLHQAIALKPDQLHARVTLAKLYQAQKRWDESSAELAQALRLKPPAQVAAACHAERSRNFYLGQRYREALAAAEAAVQALPAYAEAYERQGLALLELRRFREAARCLDQFLAAGGKPEADFFRARGRARALLGDYLGAKDDYTRALELDPDADLLMHRGWAYFFADAWKPALRDFEEAIRLNPDNADAYVGRGLTHAMLGQAALAVQDAEEAWRRTPQTPEMMHNVACTFALAAAQVERDPSIIDGHALAARYRGRALEAVSKTLALVPAETRMRFWQEKILPDNALDSIRSSIGFREIGGTDGTNR